MAADALTQKEILDQLEQMDDLQIKFFSRILDKSPWFFEEYFQRREAEEAKQRQGSDQKLADQ